MRGWRLRAQVTRHVTCHTSCHMSRVLLLNQPPVTVRGDYSVSWKGYHVLHEQALHIAVIVAVIFDDITITSAVAITTVVVINIIIIFSNCQQSHHARAASAPSSALKSPRPPHAPPTGQGVPAPAASRTKASVMCSTTVCMTH